MITDDSSPTVRSEKARTSHWLFSRRGPAFLEPLMRMYSNPIKLVQPFVEQGDTAADIGCGWGAYTFALADLVGPEGKVYALDLAGKCIQKIQQKAQKRGYRNIEACVSSACHLSMIADRSVDFVLANGLLCSMAVDRPLAVSEIKRILKPPGKAYLSLGMTPPLGYVDQAEWEDILKGFKLEAGGNFKELWAVVSLTQA